MKTPFFSALAAAAPLALCALLALFAGLAFFDYSVARHGDSLGRIDLYRSGGAIPGIAVRMRGPDARGRAEVRDFFGMSIITDLPAGSFPPGMILVLRGTAWRPGHMRVEAAQAYPRQTLKYLVSLAGALFVAWRAAAACRLTPRGLSLA